MTDKQTETSPADAQNSENDGQTVAAMEEPKRERILVIKLSALGDVVLAMGPFAAIRAAHPDAHITVLTTRPYVDLMKASGFFDSIAIDRRPKLSNVREVLALRRFLRNGNFDRVYDLQTSDRSGFYYKLFWPGPKPEWSGIARGCSHPHANPERSNMHTIDRHADQLADAGIKDVPAPYISGPDIDLDRFGIRSPFVLICPGGAPHRPAKRWPAERFGLLAKKLADYRLTPVLIGTDSEADVLNRIDQMCPKARNLMGRTGFLDIASLAARSVLAIGNDTGPMHIAAAAGAPSIVLFSRESDPKLSAPRGHGQNAVSVVRENDLRQLTVNRVMDVIRERLDLTD
ncbi:glycosyltransferase family 9 protein [Thalassospira sp.]|uniref:glycosyltransferase family 9 protein n=1 Tax=Thalassospira sp. TaxID=1912094 RepID=UPI000C4B7D8A|nr:glycosyltransferase family 9 protein [Thalassospira sp.]MBC05017.1 ADP-heptose--LPS heptosyltransferase [Thalassospira sp.]|tara:strand:+ start:8233 stop:9267 length:1035 start_codon:yes stop_codon:yes gene_type:complete